MKEFGFEGKNVRILDINGEPWWVLKDVCDVLDIQNTKDTADRVDDDEKLARPDLTSLGQRGGWIINESGLYSVILRSDKPDAKRFRKWVTSEVLPSIRKTGGYLNPIVDFSDPEKLQVVFDNWKDERRKRLEAEARTSRLIHNNHTFSTTEIAKELGMKSAQELNQKLLDMGVHFKDRRGVWLLNAEYSDKGFQNIKQKEIDGKKDPVYYAEWTGIGRDWLVGMFYTSNQDAAGRPA
jgi:prophage antirepressor-like protein